MIHPSLLYITHLIFPVIYLFIYLNDYPLIFMVLHKSVLDNVTTELS